MAEIGGHDSNLFDRVRKARSAGGQGIVGFVTIHRPHDDAEGPHGVLDEIELAGWPKEAQGTRQVRFLVLFSGPTQTRLTIACTSERGPASTGAKLKYSA